MVGSIENKGYEYDKFNHHTIEDGKPHENNTHSHLDRTRVFLILRDLSVKKKLW